MFHFLKGKNKENVLYAPCKGKVVPLSEVPDPTFSEKILGDGFAVIPSEGKIYAPISGQIVQFHAGGHAFTIRNSTGLEVLVHVGIDTVRLEGKYFYPKVKEGAKVKKGDLLLEFDIKAIEKEGFSLATPVIISNIDDFSDEVRVDGLSVDFSDSLINVIK